MKLLALTILLLLASATSYGQGSMRRPTVENERTDSEGHLKVESDTHVRNERIHGAVLLANGEAAQPLVEIIATCPETSRLMAITGEKGKFAFEYDLRLQSDGDLIRHCSLYASLEGYRSDVIPLASLNSKSNKGPANLILQPISNDPSGLSSGAGPTHRRLYDKAVERVSKMDFKGAIASLEEATAADPNDSSAWFALGFCRQQTGDLVAAEKAFLESAHADPKFVLPFIRAAAIESAAGNMAAALANSQKAIDLNPKAFPDAYAINAIAGLSTQKAEIAEKSARAGLALDTTHQYPELEYALGVVLFAKDDQAAAKQHFQNYLAQSPNGPNAATAKSQLAQMQLDNAAASQPTEAAIAPPSTAQSTPAFSLLQAHNAPLLTNPSAYTCLESISPTKVDQRGHIAELETIRVDVAIANHKEIYGSADGKSFADSSEHELLGYSFSTTGLFSSIARTLIAADQFSIQPAGELQQNGETLLRYNFHSLPTTAGWTISYGKESGVAAEQGWFLVESKNQILRRVFVAATNLPRNLKIVSLSALIDYEPETLTSHRVLLPTSAKIEVDERSNTKRKSELSFDHCRSFTAESVLSFDVAATPTQDQKAKPPRLPLNTEILVSLNSPLSLAHVEENDLITGTITKPLLQDGRELLKAGALVEGRVRLLRGENSVILQLDRVQTSSGAWAPFYAQLLKLGSSQAQIRTPAHTDVPGVATIDLAASATELPAGMQTLWKTEPLAAAKSAAVPQLGTSMSMHE